MQICMRLMTFTDQMTKTHRLKSPTRGFLSSELDTLKDCLATEEM